MSLLYPRINNKTALDIYNEISGRTVLQLRSGAANTHPEEYFASTGGNRISKEEINQIALTVRELAAEHGYPDKVGSNDNSAFDEALSRWFAEKLQIIDGEGVRPETWSFISLVILPDVVKWRFQNFHYKRCLGGRRNCFQRLWQRGKIFDLGEQSDDRWVIVSNLTEDAFVSIIERPSISENRALARAIGLSWIESLSKVGSGSMEKLNRNAIRGLRAKFTLYDFDSLGSEELNRLVKGCYEAAILQLS